MPTCSAAAAWFTTAIRRAPNAIRRALTLMSSRSPRRRKSPPRRSRQARLPRQWRRQPRKNRRRSALRRKRWKRQCVCSSRPPRLRQPEARMFPALVRFAGAAAAAAVVLAGSASAQAQSELTPPDVLVKNVTLEVVEIIQKDADMQKGDRRKIIALIDAKVLPHFNFQAMTASAVGRNWDKASLNEEFKTLLVRTYSSALAAYSNQKFDFRPLRAKPTDTDVTVNVRVLQSGTQPVTIDYDMEKRPSGWKVWDVRVAGISLVANYRTEFDNMVRESGMDGLIKALQAKNSSLDQPSTAASAGAPKK